MGMFRIEHRLPVHLIILVIEGVNAFKAQPLDGPRAVITRAHHHHQIAPILLRQLPVKQTKKIKLTLPAINKNSKAPIRLLRTAVIFLASKWKN